MELNWIHDGLSDSKQFLNDKNDIQSGDHFEYQCLVEALLYIYYRKIRPIKYLFFLLKIWPRGQNDKTADTNMYGNMK